MTDDSRSRAPARKASAVPRDLTRESLVAELASVMADIRQCAEAEYERPSAKGNILGRYADTLVRAIATLYPAKLQLELAKGEGEWDTLSPTEKMARIVQARERLDIIEQETRMLAAKEDKS